MVNFQIASCRLKITTEKTKTKKNCYKLGSGCRYNEYSKYIKKNLRGERGRRVGIRRYW